MDSLKNTFKLDMSVLHVTPFYPPSIGGIANLVYNLCNALNNLDVNVHIISSSGNNKVSTELPSEIQTSQLTEIKSIYFPGWPYPTLRNFSIPRDLGIKLDSVIKKGKYDIIHVHGHHYPMCWIAIRSAYRYKIPTVLSLHGTYALNPKNFGGRSSLEDLFNTFIFKNILSKCNVVIGGTKQIIDYAMNYSTSHTHFRQIPNGVNTENYFMNLQRKTEYRSKYGIHQNRVIILFVGRFDESKGALEFAQAAKSVLESKQNKFQILMVGKGKLESEIRTILKGLEDVKIIDWQPAEKIHEIYIASDIYVLPSRFEGLPLSIIEAMNANLHIVFSNVGGVSDILKGYLNKTMLTKATPSEIREKLINIYEDDFIPKIDEQSRNYARSFDWNIIAQSLIEIYHELKLKKKSQLLK